MNELKEMLTNIREELQELYSVEYTEEERNERESNGEPNDIWEYLADALDIEYRIDGHGNYRGAYIWVTLGGPNIHIDTFSGYIKGAWGSNREEVWLPREICDEIDSIYEDYYNGSIRC